MPQNWLMLLIMFMMQVTASFAGYTFSSLSYLIKEGLELSDTQLGMIPGVIFSAGAVATLMWGRWVDLAGARRLALIGPSLLGLALTAASLVQGFAGLLSAAVLWGIAQGSIMPITNKAVAGWFSGRRGLAIGLKQSGVTLGASLSAFLLPRAALVWTWRGAMLITGMAAVAVSLAAYGFYRDASATPPFTMFPRGVRLSPRTKPRLATVVALGFVFSAYQGIWNTFLIPFLKTRDVSLVAAGALLGCAQVMGTAGRVGLGVWSDVGRVSPQAFLGISGLLGGVAGILFSLVSRPALWMAYLLTCLIGLGAMSWAGLVFCMATKVCEESNVGYASGVVTAFTMLGGAVGPAAFGWATDRSASYWLPLTTVSGAMVLVGLAAGVAGLRQSTRTRFSSVRGM